MAQTLKDYNQDEAYRLAAEKIGYGQQAPQYAGTYENQLNDLYDKIANRQPFSYDVNADPLYDLYKDKYIQGGKLAMKDTMGQAASLTGGYGNTYGQQVGQQAYDAYLQNLSAVIPELYGMAYDKWKDQGDDLKDLYGMVGARRDTEYGQWRDLVGDYNVNRGLVQQQEATDYARLLAQDEQDYERGLTADKTAYDRQQQAYANLMALIQASGYMPTDGELAAAGLTREAADAMRNEYLRQIALQGGSGIAGGGGGGGGSSGGGYSGPGGGGGSVYIPPAGQGPGYVTIDQAADETAYYPGEIDRATREAIAASTNRSVNQVTAGEAGWNDTAGMLDYLGIQTQHPYTPASSSTTTGWVGNNTAAQQAAEAAARAEALLKNSKQKGNGGR